MLFYSEKLMFIILLHVAGAFSMLVRRLFSQLQQLRTLFATVLGLIESPSVTTGTKSNLVRDQFGLHKIIVAVTSAGKVYKLTKHFKVYNNHNMIIFYNSLGIWY